MKFEVRIKFTDTKPYLVEAEDSEEAIQKAKQEAEQDKLFEEWDDYLVDEINELID